MKQLKNSDIRALPLEQLVAKADELRRDLLELRLKSATSHVKSFSSDQKKLKKSIAQVLTHISQKQRAAEMHEG
jgi:ribosomal protein L29